MHRETSTREAELSFTGDASSGCKNSTSRGTTSGCGTVDVQDVFDVPFTKESCQISVTRVQREKEWGRGSGEDEVCRKSPIGDNTEIRPDPV